MRKVPGMNLAAKVAVLLLAWFLLIERKLTDKITRPVVMLWGHVKDYIGKVAIITKTVVDNNMENSELIKNIAQEIDTVTKVINRKNII